MAGEVRESMIDGAMFLLAQRGPDATSFSEIIATTGAPRGSLYHHFPNGKEQLIAAAVDKAGSVLIEAMEQSAGKSASEVVERFLAIWRYVLTRSDCGSGCAVLAVTVSTNSTELLTHATAVFRTWRARLAELLAQGGLPQAHARHFATMMIATAEGAVVLSRAEQNIEPFDSVAAYLLEQVRTMIDMKD